MAQAPSGGLNSDRHASKLIQCVSYGSLLDLKSFIGGKADLHTVDNKGTPLLHYAVCDGDVLEYLLRAGSHVEALDSNGATPLLSCASKGTLENMRMLIANRADIRARDKKGSTALHYAAVRVNSSNEDANVQAVDDEGKNANNNAEGHAKTVAIVEFLLERGLSIEARDNLGRTPLHHCSEIGTLENVRTLIEKGASIESRSNRGSTALHFAVVNRNTTQILNFFLDQGMDIDSSDELGFTALHLSIIFGNERNTKLLLSRGADVKARTRQNLTALHLAAAYEDTTETLQLLLEKGASISATTSDGITPLLTCACRGNLQMMKLLVEKGADILVKDENSLSSLHFAATNRGTTLIMQYLLDQGMSLEARGKLGRTPLLFSAAEGNLMNVSFLCERGANLKSLDNLKATALHHAATNVEGGSIIEYLIGRGVPVDVRDENGKTPLFIASMGGIARNERVLLENDASSDKLHMAGTAPSVTATLRPMNQQMREDSASSSTFTSTSLD